MSQNVLVEKLTMFKELHKLADKIKSRPEFTFVGKQRYRTENIPKVAETDSMFITAILYNCNPLYHLSFITDSTGNKMQGVHIESDFKCMEGIETYINENFDFNVKEKEQFKLLETLNTLINIKLTISLDTQGVFLSNDEFNKYIDRFIDDIVPCYEAIKDIDFNSKKIILRIIKSNIEFANDIKKCIDNTFLKEETSTSVTCIDLEVTAK